MSDDRFKEPPPPAPCRLYVAPGKPDYVTADEMDAWLDSFERKFQCGKHRPKQKPQPAIDLREKNE